MMPEIATLAFHSGGMIVATSPSWYGRAAIMVNAAVKATPIPDRVVRQLVIHRVETFWLTKGFPMYSSADAGIQMPAKIFSFWL